MLLTVRVVHRITRLELLLAIASIEQALSIVTILITDSILEHLPAVDASSAVQPRIDSQRTVVSIKVTGVRVALFIAPMITLFLPTSLLHALRPLVLQINRIDVHNTLLLDVALEPSLVRRIILVARLSGPLRRTEALKVAQLVLAGSSALARTRITLIQDVNLTVDTTGSQRTLATVATVVSNLALSVDARV